MTLINTNSKTNLEHIVKGHGKTVLVNKASIFCEKLQHVQSLLSRDFNLCKSNKIKFYICN